MEELYFGTVQRINNRNSKYLSGVSNKKLARSRGIHSVQLRRQKRHEITNKRRFPGNSQITHTQNSPEEVRLEIESYYQLFSSQRVPPSEKLELLGIIRNYVCASAISPDFFLHSGYIPLLIHQLNEDNFILQKEAALILCNIALGDTPVVKHMVDSGIVETAMGLIDPISSEVTHNLVWCLGNLAGDSLNLRKLLLSKGLLECILALLECDCETDIKLFETTI